MPRARMTQRWPLRPWRSQRKMYVVIYRGALRRRMRRLVRSRVFNNARTATRNLDLLPPIGRSPFHPQHVYCIGGFRPVYGGNMAGFSASAGYAGGPLAADQRDNMVPQALHRLDHRQRCHAAKEGACIGRDFAPIIKELRAARKTSLSAITAKLNDAGVPTARGGRSSSPQVMRMLERRAARDVVPSAALARQSLMSAPDIKIIDIFALDR